MILVNFAAEKSRRVALHRSSRLVSRIRFCEAPSDTVSRYAMRFIVFDGLNAYNFGARKQRRWNSLGCAQHSGVSARTRASYILWPLASPEVFIREGGWPELNREFMLSLVNWVTGENCLNGVSLLYDMIPGCSARCATEITKQKGKKSDSTKDIM